MLIGMRGLRMGRMGVEGRRRRFLCRRFRILLLDCCYCGLPDESLLLLSMKMRVRTARRYGNSKVNVLWLKAFLEVSSSCGILGWTWSGARGGRGSR